MNDQIKKLAEQAGFVLWDGEEWNSGDIVDWASRYDDELEKFAQLIAQQCADICTEMAAKCAGLPDDGAVARDCADWIRKDFGVEQ